VTCRIQCNDFIIRVSYSLLTFLKNRSFALFPATRKTTLQVPDPEEDTKNATPLLDRFSCRILECYRQLLHPSLLDKDKLNSYLPS
jgi:hypothetical protein